MRFMVAPWYTSPLPKNRHPAGTTVLAWAIFCSCFVFNESKIAIAPVINCGGPRAFQTANKALGSGKPLGRYAPVGGDHDGRRLPGVEFGIGSRIAEA